MLIVVEGVLEKVDGRRSCQTRWPGSRFVLLVRDGSEKREKSQRRVRLEDTGPERLTFRLLGKEEGVYPRD